MIKKGRNRPGVAGSRGCIEQRASCDKGQKTKGTAQSDRKQNRRKEKKVQSGGSGLFVYGVIRSSQALVLSKDRVGHPARSEGGRI